MNKHLFFILNTFILSFLWSTNSFVFSQDNEIWMYPNHGQWDENFLYKTNLHQGELAISSNAIHFNLFSLNHTHDQPKKRNIHPYESLFGQGHYLKTSFLNSNLTTTARIKSSSSHYKNYFFQENTISNVHGVQKVILENLYDKIDLEYTSYNSIFKYQYKVLPHGLTDNIVQQTDGANSMYLDNNGNLHILHSLGEIVEKKPIAWSIDQQGIKHHVNVQFALNHNQITYEFPNNYNHSDTLYIDPELVFSSFTGSTEDNWGFTATYDKHQNVYAGGITFGIGYPTNTGSYQIQYQGGENFVISQGSGNFTIPGFDITISKFSKDGKELLFTTYLGGTGNETPHSMIVNQYDELVLFGATSSRDFPITSNAFDKTFNGGTEFKNIDVIFSATDIFVTKFNASGNSLLASTFVGGSGNDGINNGILAYNYGDHFRGEINLTNKDEIIIFTSSESSDAPVKNAFQSNLKGSIDSYVFTLSPNLDNILFASYLGGENEDVGYGIQYIPGLDKIYVSGGTNSTTINAAPTVVKNSQHGGSADGFIACINNASHSLENYRFVGSQAYDQSFFVQTDLNNNIYVLSQTDGKFTISPNTFGNPNSGILIQKYTTDLSTILWQTTIGGQSGNVEISPTAFMVSDCFEIYFSGWGGETNRSTSQAVMSSTLNFPISEDAFQKTTTGDNFYLCMLGKDATTLRYGSYFGGYGNNSYHVDGGTSRFSKDGGIYHAVCGACGGNPNGFTTTQGVWSPTNKSNNCNLAAFRMELNKISAEAKASDTLLCSGSNVSFINLSKQADSYFWDFGDKSSSTETSPSHTFNKEGEYKVKLIASDSKGCVTPDTTILTIKVAIANQTITKPTIYLCRDSLINLSVDLIKDATYNWTSTKNQDITSKENSITLNTPPNNTILCNVKAGCANYNYIFPIESFTSSTTFIENKNICLGETVTIELLDIKSIDWTNHLDWKNKTNINYNPNQSETIKYQFINNNGCSFTDSLHIEVFTPSSKLFNTSDTSICIGDSLKIYTEYLKNIQWDNISYINQTKKYTYIKPYNPITYSISYEDACGPKRENFAIDVLFPKMPVSSDTTICLGDSIYIHGYNMVKYDWDNYDYAKIQLDPSVLKVSPTEMTVYYLIGTDKNGCKVKEGITIYVYKRTPFKYTQLQQADWENPAIMYVFGEGIKSVQWKPDSLLNCDTCFTVSANITQNMSYNLIITDKNTCKDSITIYLKFIDNIYVPNAFYPQSIHGNAIFKAVGTNIREFKMNIYNRWGELIQTVNNLDDGWDGKYNGQLCPNDVYIWKIEYTTIFEEFKEIHGHVTLFR